MYKLLFPYFLSVIIPVTALAQRQSTDIFNRDDSLIHLTIVAEFDSLLNKKEETKYNPAALYWSLYNDSALNCKIIELRTRGKFRRKSENCDFPPLKIKIEKEIREDSPFEAYKTIKLVTHCQSGNQEFDTYITKEYLVYRLYEIITSYAYKTALAKISYANHDSSFLISNRTGFLIENDEHLENRLDGQILGSEKGIPAKMERESYLKLALFQYMIKNNDWSVELNHNVEFLFHDPLEPPKPVPFDFDFAGIVEIPYNVPNAKGTNRLEPERHFKAKVFSMKELEPYLTFYFNKKEELLNTIIVFPYLSDAEKSKMIQYILEFYDIISSRKEVRKNLLKRRFFIF